jgi:hypothetical protein
LGKNRFHPPTSYSSNSDVVGDPAGPVNPPNTNTDVGGVLVVVVVTEAEEHAKCPLTVGGNARGLTPGGDCSGFDHVQHAELTLLQEIDDEIPKSLASVGLIIEDDRNSSNNREDVRVIIIVIVIVIVMV